MFWCCCYWVSIHFKYVDALTGEHSAESQSKFTMQPWLMNLLSPAVPANLRRQVTLLFPQVSKYYPDFLRGGQMFNLKTIFYTVKFRWKQYFSTSWHQYFIFINSVDIILWKKIKQKKILQGPRQIAWKQIMKMI